MNKYLTHC